MAYKEFVIYFEQRIEINYRSRGRFHRYIAMNSDRRIYGFHGSPFYIPEEERWDYSSNLTQYKDRCSGVFLGYYEQPFSLLSRDSLLSTKAIILIDGVQPSPPLSDAALSQYLCQSRKQQSKMKLAQLFARSQEQVE